MSDLNKQEWYDEKVVSVGKHQWLYRLFCVLSFRLTGLTYKEMYMILFHLRERQYALEKSKDIAMKEVLKLYEYNNGKLPPKIQIEDNE